MAWNFCANVCATYSASLRPKRLSVRSTAFSWSSPHIGVRGAVATILVRSDFATIFFINFTKMCRYKNISSLGHLCILRSPVRESQITYTQFVCVRMNTITSTYLLCLGTANSPSNKWIIHLY